MLQYIYKETSPNLSQDIGGHRPHIIARIFICIVQLLMCVCVCVCVCVLYLFCRHVLWGFVVVVVGGGCVWFFGWLVSLLFCVFVCVCCCFIYFDSDYCCVCVCELFVKAPLFWNLVKR